MTRAYLMQFDGGTAADYHWMNQEMGVGPDALPAGLRWHVIGLNQTGLRVIDCWSDDAAMERFATERMGPPADRRGLGRPVVEGLTVAEERYGPPAGPAFVQVVRMPGLTAEAFAEMDHAITGGVNPEGLVHHVNGPQTGGWFIIDTWTSRAIRDAFVEEHVKPNVAAAPLSGPPAFEELDVFASLSAHALAPAHA